MSDLYYDAHLTDDERRRLRDCAQISWGHLNAAVESILQARLLDLAQRAEAAEALHRDLVSRLGFGNNITEPMADNDTVVAWFEEQGREASEWRESQLWRNDCYAAGHPDDEDCFEHDPTLRAEADRAAIERVRALADEWEQTSPAWIDHIAGPVYELRAALDREEDQ